MVGGPTIVTKRYPHDFYKTIHHGTYYKVNVKWDVVLLM